MAETLGSMDSSDPNVSETLVNYLNSAVNDQDVVAMMCAQKDMLERFEKTNEMLSSFNALSSSRLNSAVDLFKQQTQLVVEMRRDLEYIFRKIRLLKSRLQAEYPMGFEALSMMCDTVEEVDEEAVFDNEQNSHNFLKPSDANEILKLRDPSITDDDKLPKRGKSPSSEVTQDSGNVENNSAILVHDSSSSAAVGSVEIHAFKGEKTDTRIAPKAVEESDVIDPTLVPNST